MPSVSSAASSFEFMNAPKVTIVIPVWNGAAWLAACLDAQSNWGIYLADVFDNMKTVVLSHT